MLRAGVVPEGDGKLLALLRMGLAEREPILRPHQTLRDRWRAGIGSRGSARLPRSDNSQVRFEQIGDRGGRFGLQNPADTLAPFRRAQRLLRLKVVAPRSRMRIDEAERRVLPCEPHKDAREDRVLDDVGESPGVEGVAVVHARPGRSAEALGDPFARRRLDIKAGHCGRRFCEKSSPLKSRGTAR